jgi:hypothetical protein
VSTQTDVGHLGFHQDDDFAAAEADAESSKIRNGNELLEVWENWIPIAG